MHQSNLSAPRMTPALSLAALLALPGILAAAEPSPGAQNLPSTAKLQRFVTDSEIGQPSPSPVAGIFRVKVGHQYVYLAADGRHAFIGDLLDLDTGTNLTERHRAGERLAALATFPESDVALFPANGEEKARVLVFTDTTCPYCRKLHQEIPALQQAGVTVGYIPFPRGGKNSEGDRQLRAVWCTDDRPHALDVATERGAGELGSGDCAAGAAVDAGYRLGIQLGVSGTPAIVLPDGELIPGYVSAASLLTRLGIGDKAAGR